MTPIYLGYICLGYREILNIQLGVKTKQKKERICIFVHFLDRFHNRQKLGLNWCVIEPGWHRFTIVSFLPLIIRTVEIQSKILHVDISL